MRPALLPSFVISAVVSLGCASSKPVVVAPPAPQVESLDGLRDEVRAIREQAGQLHRAQAELYWKSWTGAELADVANTYAGREALFSTASIVRVAELQKKTKDPQEARALAALRLNLVSEHVSRETAAEADALAELAGPATITIDGKEERPWRDLDALLAREPDAARRRRIMEASLPVVRRLTPLLLEKQRKQEALLAGLGAGGYAEFSAALRDIEPVALAELADAVLTRTERPYVDAMTRLAKERLGLPFEQLRRADLPRLFRGAEVDDLFTREQQLERVRQAVAAMGFSIDRVKVDDGAPTFKSPRPLALAVSVPDDVRLSVKPSPGLAELAKVFHEVAHALHHLHTDPALPWELSMLGPQVVPETWGHLFEALFDDPAFLSQHGVRGARLESLVLKRTARRLFELRRAAGLVLYELALQGKTGASPPETYRAILSRALGFAVTEDEAERYALDREDFFASADGLRAALLAAQVERHLAAKAGADWWNSPRTAELLKPLFAEGNRLTVDGLLERVGATRLEPDLLEARLAPAAPPAAASTP